MLRTTSAEEFLNRFEQTIKRFEGLTEKERELLMVEDSVKEYTEWERLSNNFIHPKDKFLSWFDANYPFLYDEYSEAVWRRVRGRIRWRS